MKKIQKLKGFTLVELIVVIAIIAILAAVLVPGLVGYLSDARISTANTNAAAFDKACQAGLTKAATASTTITGKGWVSATQATDGKAAATAESIKLDGTVAKIYFGSFGLETDTYLGDKFKGVGACYFNGVTYSTIMTAWADTDTVIAPALKLTEVPTEGTQIADAESTGIIGYSPKPEAGEAASTTAAPANP